MLIKYQALASLIQNKSHALYVLIGSEPFLLNDAAHQIITCFSKRAEYARTILDIETPSDWSSLLTEANSFSLFKDNVMLDARYEKKTIEAIGKELLSNYLKSINERCVIILRAPNISSKSIQWLTDNANVVVVQIYKFSELMLKQWIQIQCQSHGLNIQPLVFNHMYQFTQGSMLATIQLLKKLALCYTSGEIITESMITEHVNNLTQYELRELGEACLTGDVSRALHLLQQFRHERTEPTLILWILTQEIRLLIQLNHLVNHNTSFEAACQQLKIWSSRIQLYAKASARIPNTQLYPLLLECKQIDDCIKISQITLVWNKFDSIVLSFST